VMLWNGENPFTVMRQISQGHWYAMLRVAKS
jgi:hypothetical protein